MRGPNYDQVQGVDLSDLTVDDEYAEYHTDCDDEALLTSSPQTSTGFASQKPRYSLSGLAHKLVKLRSRASCIPKGVDRTKLRWAGAALLLTTFAYLYLFAFRDGPPPTVILISLDGFRASYLSPDDLKINPNNTRTLKSFPINTFLKPQFPSVTFTNHWTLATGLRPTEHGIISNHFWDPELKKSFTYTDPVSNHDQDFWGGVPIWGELKDNITAVCMWPGSEQGSHQPTIGIPYSGMADKDKLEIVLSWLDKPSSERPRFIALYMSDVDSTGHQFGPDTPQVSDAIGKVDNIVAQLEQGIKDRKLDSVANIIIVSDHGMGSTSNNRLIYLDDYININNATIPEVGTMAQIWPNNDQITLDMIRSLKKRKKNFEVYTKNTIPRELYPPPSSIRLPPILVVPDEGYMITTHNDYSNMSIPFDPSGAHGWNPDWKDMHAIFLAKGPHVEKLFSQDGKLQAWNDKRHFGFDNVYVKGIICTIYGRGWDCQGKQETDFSWIQNKL